MMMIRHNLCRLYKFSVKLGYQKALTERRPLSVDIYENLILILYAEYDSRPLLKYNHFFVSGPSHMKICPSLLE